MTKIGITNYKENGYCEVPERQCIFQSETYCLNSTVTTHQKAKFKNYPLILKNNVIKDTELNLKIMGDMTTRCST